MSKYSLSCDLYFRPTQTTHRRIHNYDHTGIIGANESFFSGCWTRDTILNLPYKIMQGWIQDKILNILYKIQHKPRCHLWQLNTGWQCHRRGIMTDDGSFEVCTRVHSRRRESTLNFGCHDNCDQSLRGSISARGSDQWLSGQGDYAGISRRSSWVSNRLTNNWQTEFIITFWSDAKVMLEYVVMLPKEQINTFMHIAFGIMLKCKAVYSQR